MEGLRGGDAQMYSIYNLLKEEATLSQFILCPEKSDLATICKNDKANYFTYKRSSFRTLKAIAAIVRISRKYKIDVIHVHDSTALTLALVSVLFLGKKTKLILSRKRNNKIKEFFLNTYKYSHPKISKIICVSKAVEDIFKNIIKDKSRLLTIYDAIDVHKVAALKNQNILKKEYNLADNTKIIANIASLDDQKDIYTFIDTAKKIQELKAINENFIFFVFGRGPNKEKLEQYIYDNNLQNVVILAGFRTDVLQILKEFDILLMTSIEEGLPLAIYEAFAAKVPVISTDAGGIKEVVKNGETGFITEIKNATQLSRYCFDLLHNNELKNKITGNAFDLVITKHDLTQLKQNYFDFYTSLK